MRGSYLFVVLPSYQAKTKVTPHLPLSFTSLCSAQVIFLQSTTYEMVATGQTTYCLTKYPFEINVFPAIPFIHSLYSDSGSD